MQREEADWVRRPARRKVGLTAIAKTSSGAELRVYVSDISYEGCNLLTASKLEVGEPVEVLVHGLGKMNGQVRWVAGERAGITFLLGSMFEQRRLRIGV